MTPFAGNAKRRKATSSDQPIVEFLAFGAPDDTAPAPVVGDLREVIRVRDAERWFELLATVQALRWKRRTEDGEGSPRDTSAIPRPNFRRVSRSTWAWGESADGCEATLSGDVISWNRHARKDHAPKDADPKDPGNTIQQSLADFIANGPGERSAPDGLAWEMFNAIRDRDPKRWPELLVQPDAPAAAALEPAVVTRTQTPMAVETRPTLQRSAWNEPPFRTRRLERRDRGTSSSRSARCWLRAS